MCLQLLGGEGQRLQKHTEKSDDVKNEKPSDFEGDQRDREGAADQLQLRPASGVQLASLSGRLCAPTLQRDPLTDELLACTHCVDSV